MDFPVSKELWDLPSCPQIISRILNLSPLDEAAVPQLLELMRWDPALTVRLLAAANCTNFGLSWPVVSMSRARLLLDDFTVRQMALQFSLHDPVMERETHNRLRHVFWREAHVRAIAANILCPDKTEVKEINPFLAGLLFGLDRLELIQSRPDVARRIQEEVSETGQAWDAVETKYLSPEKITSANSILQRVNLPAAFHEANRTQRETALPETALPEAGRSVLAGALMIAETIAAYFTVKDRAASITSIWMDRLKQQLATFRGGEFAKQDSRDRLLESIEQTFAESCRSSQVIPNSMQMLEQANRELARLGREASEAMSLAQSRTQRAEQSLQQFELKILSLERQALRDPLTGVYNRRFLLEALQKEVARGCRGGLPIGMLFLDVDDFKPLNDSRGHLVGDHVLRRIAETLTEVLRGADILARYGGEEFVIIPNEPDEKGIVQFAERLRLAVEQMVVKVEEGTIRVTISVGCAFTVPSRNDAGLGSQLLAVADAAMYEAKELGKNRVVFRSMLDPTERELVQRTLECSFSHWLVKRNILSSSTMEDVLRDYSPERTPLGELAIDTGFLADDQVADILESQKAHDARFGALAIERALLTSEQLAMLLSRQRENPIQLARLLIASDLLAENRAMELVNSYLAEMPLSTVES